MRNIFQYIPSKFRSGPSFTLDFTRGGPRIYHSLYIQILLVEENYIFLYFYHYYVAYKVHNVLCYKRVIFFLFITFLLFGLLIFISRLMSEFKKAISLLFERFTGDPGPPCYFADSKILVKELRRVSFHH